MKKLYSFFAAVVMAVAVNAQTTVTEVAAEQFGTTTITDIEDVAYPIDTNLEYSLATNGANAPAFYPADGIRMYSVRASGEGNILTIKALNGVKITELIVNAFSASYTPAVTYSVDGGAFQPATWDGTTLKITGIEASSTLAIKNAHTGGSSNLQLRFPSFSVTYNESALAVTDIKSAKKSLVKNTNVDNTLIFAAKSDVKVYNVNGQVVKTVSVNENTSVDVSALPKGMYIVTGDVEGHAVSQKILKK